MPGKKAVKRVGHVDDAKGPKKVKGTPAIADTREKPISLHTL